MNRTHGHNHTQKYHGGGHERKLPEKKSKGKTKSKPRNKYKTVRRKSHALATSFENLPSIGKSNILSPANDNLSQASTHSNQDFSSSHHVSYYTYDRAASPE